MWKELKFSVVTTYIKYLPKREVRMWFLMVRVKFLYIQTNINTVTSLTMPRFKSCRRPWKTWSECVKGGLTVCNLSSTDPLNKVKWIVGARHICCLQPTPRNWDNNSSNLKSGSDRHSCWFSSIFKLVHSQLIKLKCSCNHFIYTAISYMIIKKTLIIYTL